eukprot:scaffold93455_cov36-Tisochrysis_lutea.AAC.1
MRSGTAHRDTSQASYYPGVCNVFSQEVSAKLHGDSKRLLARLGQQTLIAAFGASGVARLSPAGPTAEAPIRETSLLARPASSSTMTASGFKLRITYGRAAAWRQQQDSHEA